MCKQTSIIVLMCGDRNWNNFKVVEEIILTFPKDIEIVEGDCRGADKISGFLGRKHGLIVHAEPANWTTYGCMAGPIRNRLMLSKYHPKEVFAFHNNINSSKGTKDMINAALDFGLSVKLFNDKGECLLLTPVKTGVSSNA